MSHAIRFWLILSGTRLCGDFISGSLLSQVLNAVIQKPSILKSGAKVSIYKTNFQINKYKTLFLGLLFMLFSIKMGILFLLSGNFA